MEAQDKKSLSKVLNFASGAAQLFPGVGPAIGLGLQGVNQFIVPQLAQGGQISGTKHGEYDPVTGQSQGVLTGPNGTPTAPVNAVAAVEDGEVVIDNYVYSKQLLRKGSKKSFADLVTPYIPDDKDDKWTADAKKIMRQPIKQEQDQQKAELEAKRASRDQKKQMKEQGALQEATQKFLARYGGYLPDGDEKSVGKHTFGAASVYGGMPTYVEGGQVQGLLNYLGQFDTGQPGAFMQRQQGMVPPGVGTGPDPESVYPLQPFMTPQDQGKSKADVISGAPTTIPGQRASWGSALPNTVNSQSPAPKSGQFGWQNLLPYAGDIYNTVRGLSKREYAPTRENEQMGKFHELYARARKGDMDPLLDAVNNATAQAHNAIGNQNPSRGGMQNQMTNTSFKAQQANADAWSRETTRQAGVDQWAAGNFLQQGAQDQRYQMMLDDSRLQTDAGARGHVAAGLTGGAKTYQNIQNEGLQLELLEQMYGQYGPMGDLLANIIGYKPQNSQ